MRAAKLRGFAFSFEALLSLTALAAIALLLSHQQEAPGFSQLHVVLAAGDAAEVLLRNPQAREEIALLAEGSPNTLKQRLERMAASLGACLEVRSGSGTASSGCGPRGLGFNAVRARSFWNGVGFLQFEVEASA